MAIFLFSAEMAIFNGGKLGEWRRDRSRTVSMVTNAHLRMHTHTLVLVLLMMCHHKVISFLFILGLRII